MASNFSKKFKTLLCEALSTLGKAKNEKEDSVNKLREFIHTQKSAESFEVMLDVYMQEYQLLESNNDNDAVYISEYFFEMLFQRRVETATFYDDFVQRCIEVLLYMNTNTNAPELLINKNRSSAIGEDITRRFKSLKNSVWQNNIIKYLKIKQTNKKESLSLFEILVDMFWVTNRRFPEEDNELFNFNPESTASMKELLQVRASLKSEFERGNQEGLKKTLLELAELVSGKDNKFPDINTSFQYFLWSRRFVVKSELSSISDERMEYMKYTINELYLVCSQSLIKAAINNGYHFVQVNLISEAELEIILAPLGKSEYYSTYHDRFKANIYRGPLPDVPSLPVTATSIGDKFIELTLLHLELLLFAREMHIRLASSEEQDEMLNELLNSDPIELRNRKVRIPHETLGNYIRLNQVLEGVATITYLPASYGSGATGTLIQDIGICWKNIDHFIFLVNASDLSRITVNRYYEQLYEGTKHLLILIQPFFRILTYIEVLITSGPPGLLAAILEDVIIDEVSEHIENETYKTIFQLAAGLLGRPTIAGLRAGRRVAKGALKGAVKAVRRNKVKKKPNSTLPEMKIVKPRRLLKFREIREKPFIYGEQRLSREQSLSLTREQRLKEVTNIDLGHPRIKKKDILTGMDDLVQPNGLDTISLLFGNSIVNFSKLAQHWPRQIENELVEEVTKLIRWKVGKKKIRDIVLNGWKRIRTNFSKRVWEDKALVQELKKIGIYWQSGGRAPVLKLPGIKVTINYDHILRKIDYPKVAFSIENIRMATPLENSALKETLEKSIQWPATEVGKIGGSIAEISEKEFDEMIDKMIDNLSKLSEYTKPTM